jgi:hypothetical protein
MTSPVAVPSEKIAPAGATEISEQMNLISHGADGEKIYFGFPAALRAAPFHRDLTGDVIPG